MNNFVAHRIAEIRQELPTSVRLIVVTKGVSVELMREAYAAGVRDFGESRVPEAIEKQAALSDLPDICWHMIGHLQANKVRKALQLFQWIHTVDSLKLCQQIDRISGELAIRPMICLQVKLLPDPQKFGWAIDELMTDLAIIDRCEHLQVQGLMAIPPWGLDESAADKFFLMLWQLLNQVNCLAWPHISISELSMGMSNDYRLAVAKGSTMVRVGSKIFAP